MKLAEVKNGLVIQDGTLSFNKARQLTPKQLAMLKYMRPHQRDRYMMSLLGIIKTKVEVLRPRRGGVEPLATTHGQVLGQFKRLQNMGINHVPSSNTVGQWVGVEIECYIPNDGDDDNYCSDCDDRRADCGCRSNSEDGAIEELKSRLRQARLTRVSVKGDGSLDSDDGYAIEVTLLFNTKYGFDQLERLCKVLNGMHCFVNDKCGLHVHLDVRHLKKTQVAKMGHSIGNTLPVLKWIVDSSRHDNTYCELDVSRFRAHANRYYAVNLTSFFKFKTIEVRLHGGSTNFDKIKNWIDLLRHIGSTRVVNQTNTFQEFIDATRPSDKLVEYMERRISKLHGETAWAKLMPSVETVAPVVEPMPAPRPELTETDTQEYLAFMREMEQMRQDQETGAA